MSTAGWKEFLAILGPLFGYCLVLRLYIAQPWRIVRKSPGVVLAALMLNTLFMTGLIAGGVTLATLVITVKVNQRQSEMFVTSALLVVIFFLFRKPVQKRLSAIED